MLGLLVVLIACVTTRYETIAPDFLKSLKRYAEYSAAAYCPENYVTSPANLSICPAEVCADLQSPNIARIHAFPETSESPAAAILAIDHQERLITASFRGTVTNEDWQTNIDFFLANAGDICQDCEAHAGFLEAWHGARKPILDSWKLLHTKHPHYNTVVTGHSLGGALATFCALEMRHLNHSASISLFTYGMPRVGDENFARAIETTLRQNSYRVTHLNDPVPRLPPEPLGFKHAYPEFHITSPKIPNLLRANKAVLISPANLAVPAGDVIRLESTESDAGVEGYNCSNIAMHDAYFINISKCVAGDNTPLLGAFAEDICGVLDICCKG